MKDKVKKYFKEAIVFVFMLMIIMNVISYYRALDLNKESLDIKSFRLIDNTEYLIPDNKKILVHFWATWCPTCKFEASNIEKISKDYEVITVAVQSGSREQVQKYLDDNELTFKVVNDDNALYLRKFNIKIFPTTLIFDKNKQLKFSEVGYTSTAGLYSRMLLVE